MKCISFEETLKTIYYNLIHSHISFENIIYNGKTSVKNIQDPKTS